MLEWLDVHLPQLGLKLLSISREKILHVRAIPSAHHRPLGNPIRINLIWRDK